MSTLMKLALWFLAQIWIWSFVVAMFVFFSLTRVESQSHDGTSFNIDVLLGVDLNLPLDGAVERLSADSIVCRDVTDTQVRCGDDVQFSIKEQWGSIQIFLDTEVLASKGCRSFRQLVDCIRTGISEPIERDTKIGSRLHRLETRDRIISVSPDIVLISNY
jgi:hypothetical protein